MRFGGYVRVSKVGGRAGDRFLSPKLQHERIQGWCDANGHELAVLVEDLDVSGGRDDRDQLLTLVERVERGHLQGLVVATLDRFGRSLPFAIALIDRIDKAGGQFVSVADGLDTRTPYGRLALNIISRSHSSSWSGSALNGAPLWSGRSMRDAIPAQLPPLDTDGPWTGASSRTLTQRPSSGRSSSVSHGANR